MPETRAAEPTRVSADETQGPVAEAADKLRAIPKVYKEVHIQCETLQLLK